MSRRADRADQLSRSLATYTKNVRPLPGIVDKERADAFIEQLVESTRRTEYVRTMLDRPLSEERRLPNCAGFDPVLGAIVCMRNGDYEEACWLTLLGVQFGRARVGGWELCRAVYGRLGNGPTSSWTRTVGDVSELCNWIEDNAERIRIGPPRRRFGNHRKYESLKETDGRGTPRTIRTYVAWVKAIGSHKELIDSAIAGAEDDPYLAFDTLYRSMSAVASFGRLARFDYLSMLGKLRVASIKAGSTYLTSSTGPLKGAQLLFTQKGAEVPSTRIMDSRLRDLGEALGVTMQDLEDAICNWQKSPNSFKAFRG